MCCKDCGGTMVGDGVTQVLQCEFADQDKMDEACYEPDAGPIFCGLVD